jgi:hypothetical protein
MSWLIFISVIDRVKRSGLGYRRIYVLVIAIAACFRYSPGERCPYFRGLCPAGSTVPDVIHPAAIDGENLAGDEAGLQ